MAIDIVVLSTKLLNNTLIKKVTKEYGQKENKVPPARDIHEPHGNGYSRKHQQSCHCTNKQRCRRRTKAQV